MKFTFVAVAAVALSMMVGFTMSKGETAPGLRLASINRAEITVETADTPELREKGLSHRNSLEPNRGLFFQFDNSGSYAIWMKDMKFPIDVIWMDEEMKIVDIKENMSPNSYPETYMPRNPSRFILETNAGFTQKHQIEVGDKMTFVR